MREQGDDAQLLECFLAKMNRNRDNRALAQRLLSSAVTLRNLMNAPEAMLEREGLNRREALLLSLIPQIARVAQRESFPEHPLLNNYRRASEFLENRYIGRRYEHVFLLCLNRKGYLIREVLLQRGSANSAPVYIRNVLFEVASHDASYLVVSHNHPANTKDPSRADLQSTLSLIATLSPLGIPVLDHILIAGGAAISIRGSGLLQERLWRAQSPDDSMLQNWLNG